MINNYCCRVFLFTIVLILTFLVADSNLTFLPINGLWLIIYILVLVIVTIWLACVNIQRLLQRTIPFEYDFKSIHWVKRLDKIYRLVTRTVDKHLVKKNRAKEEEIIIFDRERYVETGGYSIDKRIDCFVDDIEKNFIGKWYTIISDEKTFVLESRALLEGVLRRLLQVSAQMDNSKIACGVLTILLKHLKEYRRAEKRAQKNHDSIENVFSLSVGRRPDKREPPQPAADHETVIRKKKPKRRSISSTPKLSPKKEIKTKPDDVDLTINKPKLTRSGSESVIEQALTKLIAQHTAPILQKAQKIIEIEPPETERESPPSDKFDHDSTKMKTFSPKRSDPVQIYSPRSSSKNWDDSDLSNVSIGQDMLVLDGLDSSGLHGFSGRRLWGYSTDADKSNPFHGGIESVNKDNEKEILDEVRGSPKIKSKRSDGKERIKVASPQGAMPLYLKPSTTSASAFVTNTIKPLAGNVTATTLHNMRELQQSTEKAIHKIGDLQDEAVGVVEGIFDFGMAGIRKGLRLTGLQDNAERLPQSGKHNPRLAKLGHVISEDTKTIRHIASDQNDTIWLNPLAKDSPNGYENQMLLEKSPAAPEADAIHINKPLDVSDVSAGVYLYPGDSPEYEETADLASAISKLRSLLQQKSSESSVNTPALSPMLIDDKSCPTPTEPHLGEVARGDGGMQRFARTVTGMFNTFKTALPGNASEQTPNRQDQWLFIENELKDTDLPSLLQSLLVERRDYCNVDTAYEAMDSVDLLTDSIASQVGQTQWDSPAYEDDLDDLESRVPITKVLLDVICECLQDTKCPLNKEPVMKAALILTGVKIEELLQQYSEKFLRYMHRMVGPLPNNNNDEVMAMERQAYVDIIAESLPYYVRDLLGLEDIRKGLNFFVSSLQSAAINQDMVVQLFEFVTSQLIRASSQMSPTPSA